MAYQAYADAIKYITLAKDFKQLLVFVKYQITLHKQFMLMSCNFDDFYYLSDPNGQEMMKRNLPE